MPDDKQPRGIQLAAVLEKRRLDQSLNAKEFAVCAGVSYSTARSWFRLPGFPSLRGVVFWQDFVTWRTQQKQIPNGSQTPHLVSSPIWTGAWNVKLLTDFCELVDLDVPCFAQMAHRGFPNCHV